MSHFAGETEGGRALLLLVKAVVSGLVLGPSMMLMAKLFHIMYLDDFNCTILDNKFKNRSLSNREVTVFCRAVLLLMGCSFYGI